jgi:hypothetical protein
MERLGAPNSILLFPRKPERGASIAAGFNYISLSARRAPIKSKITEQKSNRPAIAIGPKHILLVGNSI